MGRMAIDPGRDASPSQSMSMIHLLQLLFSTVGWGQTQKVGLDKKWTSKCQMDLNHYFEMCHSCFRATTNLLMKHS